MTPLKTPSRAGINIVNKLPYEVEGKILAGLDRYQDIVSYSVTGKVRFHALQHRTALHLLTRKPEIADSPQPGKLGWISMRTSAVARGRVPAQYGRDLLEQALKYDRPSLDDLKEVLSAIIFIPSNERKSAITAVLEKLYSMEPNERGVVKFNKFLAPNIEFFVPIGDWGEVLVKQAESLNQSSVKARAEILSVLLPLVSRLPLPDRAAVFEAWAYSSGGWFLDAAQGSEFKAAVGCLPPESRNRVFMHVARSFHGFYQVPHDLKLAAMVATARGISAVPDTEPQKKEAQIMLAGHLRYAASGSLPGIGPDLARNIAILHNQLVKSIRKTTAN